MKISFSLIFYGLICYFFFFFLAQTWKWKLEGTELINQKYGGNHRGKEWIIPDVSPDVEVEGYIKASGQVLGPRHHDGELNNEFGRH